MKFRLPYEIQVADRKIHDDAYRGPITLTGSRILQQSSNVGTVDDRPPGRAAPVVQVDRDVRVRQADRAGPLSGAARLGAAVDDWYGSSIGNIPIGQGISVTPMQMAALYAAIANDGVLVEPHVIKQDAGPRAGQADREGIISTRGRPPDGEHAERACSTRRPAAPASGADPRYTVAGKTGTAQKPIPAATRPPTTCVLRRFFPA
jgi:cell division protein FtsI/penicillin-binding protein 2